MLRRCFETIVFVILISFLMTGCEAKEQITINAKQENFTITLPANPTTGFLWSVVDYDKEIFELIKQQYIRSKEGLVGAGGNSLFTFKLKKQSSYPSSSIIKFKYSRSWEPKSAIDKEIKIIIKST